MSTSAARASTHSLAAAVLVVALLLPVTASAGPHRVVVIDQIHCRTVKGPAGSRTVCTIQQQRKTTQPQGREAPDAPPLAQAPRVRAAQRPFIDLDRKLDIPPPLSSQDMPAPLPEPPHEAELPGALRELPAPLQPAPVKPAPSPRPTWPSPSPDSHSRSAPLQRTPPPSTARRPNASVAVLTAQEAQVFTLLNSERRRRGLAPLRVDPAAVVVARAHSRDMCQRRYFSHNSPQGLRPWDRLRAGRVQFSAAAENIAVGYSSGYAAHQGWLASPGHRANRLSSSYTRMGVGLHICPGQPSLPYWTEVFIK